MRTAIPGAFLPFSSGLKFSSAMTTPSRKRLMRDFKRELALGVDDRARNPSPPLRAQESLLYAAGLQEDPPEGVNASPQEDNIMKWNAIIFGPEGTIWDGGEALCACVGSDRSGQEQRLPRDRVQASSSSRWSSRRTIPTRRRSSSS